MIPEPIISVADLLPDDRRTARMGLVGDCRRTPNRACLRDLGALRLTQV
jgi:hypothetical protein